MALNVFQYAHTYSMRETIKTLAKWLSGCGKDVSEYPVQFYEAPT